MSDAGRSRGGRSCGAWATAIALPLAGGDGARRDARGAAAAAGRPARGWPSSTSPTASTWPTGRPQARAADFALPATLEPLAPFKDDLLVLTGLAHDKARPNGDGPGDHARALAAFLTGAQPRKTAGADIQVGRLGRPGRRPAGRPRDPVPLAGARHASGGAQAGNCDSGYSCAYSSNISWRSASRPRWPRRSTRGSSSTASSPTAADERRDGAKRDRYQQSILDFVAEDAGGLKAPARRRPTAASSTST